MLPLGSTFSPVEPDLETYNKLFGSLNDKISYVFKNYGLDETLMEVKETILGTTFLEDLRYTDEKLPFLERIMDPLSS